MPPISSHPFRRVWILLAIALGLLALLRLDPKVAQDPVAPVSPTAPIDLAAPAVAPEASSMRPSGTRAAETLVALEPPLGSRPAPALTSPIAVPRTDLSAWQRPLELAVVIPSQAVHASTFDVSVGLPLGPPLRSAQFRVSYDVDAMELQSVTDASGTELMVVPSESGVVELEFDTSRGVVQAPTITFVARTDAPQRVYLTVAAEAWDGTGQPLAIAPVAPYPIVLVP